MSESPSRLLSELRAAIEFQVDTFGPMVYQDRNETESHEKTEAAPPSDEERAAGAASESGVGDDGRAAGLFGEPVRVAESGADDDARAAGLFGEPLRAAPASTPGSPYARIAELIPEASPLHTFETLLEVERYVASTVLIPLDESRTNPVFGVGNPDADLMVIGEAPGADEDRQGEPFVGRAGQLLTKILQAIGFERDDVYIANILKSRPPNNRDPLPVEIQAHIPVLYRQISLVRPKVMLCVGKTAGTSLLQQQTSLAKLRGTFHDFHGLPVLVTFHPAALLRNPNWKRPTWEDVQLLRTRYDELGGFRRPVQTR